MGRAPLWMPLLVTFISWLGLRMEPAYTPNHIGNLIIYATITAGWIAWFTGLW